MKKLYEVDLSITVYVVAETEGQIKDVLFKESIHDIFDLNFVDIEASPATSVIAEWGSSSPFGDDEDLTCDEYLSKAKENITEEQRMRALGAPEMDLGL
jgi:hypothetical protein